MKCWLIVAAALLAGCSTAPDEAESVAVVARFHAALNAGDWVAIDTLLSQSSRDLRPGGGTARAFRAITQRHGRYLDGALGNIASTSGHTSITWRARYQRGAVFEQFGLAREGGAIRIDSYTDNNADSAPR